MSESSKLTVRRILVVGLIGGIASGKSFVAEQFRRLGAVVLDADRAGHEVLRLPEVRAAARQHWGEKIFDGDEIVRSRLAKIVFDPLTGAAELRHLESITHPRIAQRLNQQLAAMSHEGGWVEGAPQVAILDAPVMFKAGWNGFCDKIVYVDAPVEIRLARARARGWNQEDFARREAAQESMDAKRELADLVIDNSGNPQQTVAQCEQVWQLLVGSLPPD